MKLDTKNIDSVSYQKIHVFNFIFRQRNYQSQFFTDCVIETIIWTEDQDTYLVLKNQS